MTFTSALAQSGHPNALTQSPPFGGKADIAALSQNVR
jgi:hypothetical protein